MRNLEPAQQKWTRRRLGVLASLLFLFAFGVTKRAYDLQVRGAAVLRREAEAQYRNTIRLSPMRGTIYDRDGAELAVSVQVDSVFANPRDVQRGGRSPAEVARLLATAIPGLDVGRIEARLASGKRFVFEQLKPPGGVRWIYEAVDELCALMRREEERRLREATHQPGLLALNRELGTLFARVATVPELKVLEAVKQGPPDLPSLARTAALPADEAEHALAELVRRGVLTPEGGRGGG